MILLCQSTPLCAQAVPLGQSQQATYTVYGRISLPEGQPAARVVVKVKSSSGFDRDIFVDDHGRYEIRDLPRGRYFLTVENPADPDQYTDPVEADTARATQNRLLVHIFLRTKLQPGRQQVKGASTVSVAEATQHIPKSARKAFEDGLKFLSRKEDNRAQESFDRSIELFPDYFQALSERGQYRLNSGRVEEASGDFDSALKINPVYGPALRGIAMARIQQKHYGEAIGPLEQAVKVDSADITAYLLLGMAQLGLDRREAARQALDQALSIDPKRGARAHVHLATLHLRENRPLDAAAALETYLKLVPEAPDAEKLRQLVLQLRGQK
ncbi:MAG: tetratricopeptide repeat protein [Acidobacteriota bacterium]